jgi:hypothetical protein
MMPLQPKDSGSLLRILAEKVEVLLGERGDPKMMAVRQGDLNKLSNQLVEAILTQAGILSGNGSPEGAVTAKVGTLYRRLDGGASTTLYVKQSGVGNTGWAAK